MSQTPLRVISKQTCNLYAREIPRLGFGSTEETRRVLSATAYVTGTSVQERVFQLTCGCHVTSYSECGGSCIGCRAELEQEIQDDPLAPVLTPQELDWMTTPCKEHFRRCFRCDLGLCKKHLEHGPDGEWYCSAHFREVSYESRLTAIGERHGFVAAKTYGFVASLFFDNADVRR